VQRKTAAAAAAMVVTFALRGLRPTVKINNNKMKEKKEDTERQTTDDDCNPLTRSVRLNTL